MNIIVLDLEWNQCPDGKRHENPRLPFEIIEIGAVKLDEHLKQLDTFHEIVTPTVYSHLHRHTKEVIPLREKDLRGHKHFSRAASDFFRWCGGVYGKDYIICTWGPADLPELQRNMEYFHLEKDVADPFPFPLFYLDAQKVFGMVFEGKKTSRSLSYAVDFLHLDKSDRFHTALADAVYTAGVTAHLPAKDLSTWYSMDYYRLPKNRKEEVHLIFPTYTKYVSRPFADRESMLHDYEAASSVCCSCGRRCRRKIRWFTSGSRTMLSLAWCPEHGYMQGKMRIRYMANGKLYVIKTQKLIDADKASMIREKKNAAALRARKRAKLQHTVN